MTVQQVFRVRGVAGLLILFTVLTGRPGMGQDQSDKPAALRRLPASVERHVKAVGRRALEKDKEETVLTGTFAVDNGPPAPVRVVHQLSGEVVLEGFKANRTLSFDGRAAAEAADDVDDALLDMFALDSVEGLFASLQSGASIQVLGHGFKSDADPRIAYDILDVGAPARTRRDRPLQTRRYFFDASTGLLAGTRYEDRSTGRGVQVETRFSDWRKQEGSHYPGRIERFEDGRLRFSFVSNGVHNGPKGHSDHRQP
jgi:hypothetical protein